MLTTSSHVWNLSRLFSGDAGNSIPSCTQKAGDRTIRPSASFLSRLSAACVLLLICPSVNSALAGNQLSEQADAATAFKRFVESPPIIKNLRARFSVRTESFRLLPEEIAKAVVFAEKLGDSTESDSITYYLRTNLTAPVIELISTNNLASVQSQLPAALAKDLNRLLPVRPMFEAKRFEGIQLPQKIQNVVGRRDMGQDLPRINRGLLHAAFPQEIPSDGHITTNYIFAEIRYQPGAAFFRSATRLEDLDEHAVVPLSRLERLDGYPSIACTAAGYFGPKFWCIGNSTYQSDRLSDSLLLAYSKSNRNPVTVQSALFATTRIMNMGLSSEKLGGIHWENNVAKGFDRSGNPFSATLNLDPTGRPLFMDIQRPNNAEKNAANGRVAYNYSSNISGWVLPTTIELENTNWMVDILSVEISEKAAEEYAFSANPFINRNSMLMMISTKVDEKQISSGSYDDFRDGMRKLFWGWLSKDAIRSRLQFFYCALTLCFVGVGFAIDYKQKTKRPNKDTNE